MGELPKSALVYILKGLIPYTDANLKLAFSPNRFFNDLEKISQYKKSTFKTTMWRAENRGYIRRVKNSYQLTELGKNKIKPYTAKKLEKEARLMIIFDIPENKAHLRNQLRWLLRQWDFYQIQKSVWATAKDYKKDLITAIEQLGLEDWVELYESAKLFPKK